MHGSKCRHHVRRISLSQSFSGFQMQFIDLVSFVTNVSRTQASRDIYAQHSYIKLIESARKYTIGTQ